MKLTARIQAAEQRKRNKTRSRGRCQATQHQLGHGATEHVQRSESVGIESSRRFPTANTGGQFYKYKL